MNPILSLPLLCVFGFAAQNFGVLSEESFKFAGKLLINIFIPAVFLLNMHALKIDKVPRLAIPIPLLGFGLAFFCFV